jgi:cytochrome c-type biogenesis protein CcmF
MVQERRGMFRVWNMGLVILTYALTVIGTFLTRAGLVSSVHAFAQSDIGGYFLVFTAAVTLGSIALLGWRLGALRDDAAIESALSRETGFLANNIFLLGALFAVFWGTLWPIFNELISDERVTVGPPYFNLLVVPIFWILIALMAVGPLLGWRRTDPERLTQALLRPGLATLAITLGLAAAGVRHWLALAGIATCVFALLLTLVEIASGVRARAARGEPVPIAAGRLFRRNRRRYGGYVVHVGVAVLGLGVIGSNVFQSEAEQTLAVGESMTVGAYELAYEGVAAHAEPDREILGAPLRVTKGGRDVGQVVPTRQLFRLREDQPQTIPGVLSRPLEDVYVLLGTYDPESGKATFKAFVNPLIGGVWLGMLILVAGTLIAAWPDAAEERVLNAELKRLLGSPVPA